MDLVNQALARPDNCPEKLREVVLKWKIGQATNHELIEASYQAQLGLVEEYRWKPLPTVPHPVLTYRQLSWEERSGWTKEEHDALRRNCADFFTSEATMTAKNHSNRATLKELLEWAKERALADDVVKSIQIVLSTHHDHGTF